MALNSVRVAVSFLAETDTTTLLRVDTTTKSLTLEGGNPALCVCVSVMTLYFEGDNCLKNFSLQRSGYLHTLLAGPAQPVPTNCRLRLVFTAPASLRSPAARVIHAWGFSRCHPPNLCPHRVRAAKCQGLRSPFKMAFSAVYYRRFSSFVKAPLVQISSMQLICTSLC